MASNWADINGVGDEDAALRRAIAMSLGEDVPGEELPTEDASSSSPIDEEEALRQAIAMSLGEDLHGIPAQDTAKPPAAETVGGPSQPPASSLSALGLDRKKMEEERLARTRKRKADESAENDIRLPPVQRPRSIAVDSFIGNATESGVPQQDLQPSLNSNVGAADGSTKSAMLPYPHGAVRKTWVLGQPRRPGVDITIEEVFQKDHLELAVLSSFQWDEEWLMKKLNMERWRTRKTKVLLIAYAQDEDQKASMRANAPGNDVFRFCFPPMEGGSNCMHSKLQLLKFPKYLRIVIPSANLTDYDWGETGVMENMVFLIDLPLIEDESQRPTNALTFFGEELCYFLKAQGIDNKMVASLHRYDFSETSRYGFVHTIAGSHSRPNDWQRTGYCGLGRAVKQLGLGTKDEIEIDFVCSAIGAVKRDLLQALYNACQGDSGLKEYEARTGKGKSKDTSSQSDVLDERIRVYFPSSDTVAQSRGGTDSAGTIAFQSKWFEASTFPRKILRDCKNVSSGVLMHSKILFVRRNSGAAGWVLCGSANLSESAWGRLVKDRTTSQPKLSNCRNWECGVLIPVESRTSPGASGPQMLDIFREAIPVPMELPGASYDRSNGSLRPWFYSRDSRSTG